MNINFLIMLIIVSTNADIKPTKYIINLDLPPNERWKNVANDFKYTIGSLKDILLLVHLIYKVIY